MPFRSKTRKALPTLDDEHSKVFLELLNSGRERGLRNLARSCSPREVPLPVECNNVFQISNDHGASILLLLDRLTEGTSVQTCAPTAWARVDASAQTCFPALLRAVNRLFDDLSSRLAH